MSSVHAQALISATCGKHIQILDTETDILITRISVAAPLLSAIVSYSYCQRSDSVVVFNLSDSERVPQSG